jgi:hypothetical protein
MPVLVTGYTYEQKVVTVSNNDTAINAEIDTQAPGDWVLNQITISGTDAILLFSRNVADVLP